MYFWLLVLVVWDIYWVLRTISPQMWAISPHCPQNTPHCPQNTPQSKEQRVMISHKELAKNLGVSTETLRRHKLSLENKYNRTFGKVNGARVEYSPTEASFLNDSINKRMLPDRFHTLDEMEADVIDETPLYKTSAIVQRVEPVERDFQPLSIQLQRQDLSALQSQIEQSAVYVHDGLDLIESTVLDIVSRRAEVLGARVKEEYLYQVAKAEMEVVKEISNPNGKQG